MVLFYRCMRACDLCPETCVFGEGLRQLPLAGIAPERTHGPEGVGRVYPYGVGGFLHFGLDVRVDLRGRGCQLCACHGSAPPWMLLPANPFSSSRCRKRQAHSQTDSAGDTRIFPRHWCCAEVEGARLLPCRITGVVRHTDGESVRQVAQSSIPD